MLRQDILFELDAEYKGNPYHISGNAILHALAHMDRIDYKEQQQLRFAHGVFCPSVYGVFPNWHSQSSGRMSFAATLKPIEQYADLFLFRRPSHPWIHDGRARDAINTPAIKWHGETPLVNSSQAMQISDGKPRKSQLYIHTYVTQTADADLLPLDESTLDGIQLGGARNYGLGEVRIKDTMLTDLDEIDYSNLYDADGHVLELLTPYVLESTYPKTNDRKIPNWWDKNIPYRTREGKIVDQREIYKLKVVDQGQVTKYYGPDAVETAKNGVERVGTHSKYGFGEFVVRPT